MYCLAKKRVKPNGVYGALFEVDLKPIASILKVQTESNKHGLIGDTRRAGAAWNSKNGLWGPLLKISEAVVGLGGPSFIPDNA